MNGPPADKFDFDEPSTPNRWIEWLKTLARWDGALPLAIGATAPVMNLLFPRHPEVGTLVAVFLPIAGFFIRLSIGNQYFQSHSHFIWQRALFIVAVFWLVIIDATLILFSLMPDGILRRDWNVWFMMYATYLAAMALALYPRADQAAPASSIPRFRFPDASNY